MDTARGLGSIVKKQQNRGRRHKWQEHHDKFDIHFYELAEDGTIEDYADYIGEDGWIGGLDVNEVVELVNTFLYRKENDIW